MRWCYMDSYVSIKVGISCEKTSVDYDQGGSLNCSTEIL